PQNGRRRFLRDVVRTAGGLAAAILGFRCTGHNALHLRQLNGALLEVRLFRERVRRIQRQVVH
ncbi:hypothetical protein D0Z88_20860, partial [Salmonella enterica subsp. enterica serovar Newport]|nr:hypothetical protein [Salmonella enterica subsp. enterica serovar Newport]